MQTTWRPTAAGVLAIIGGALNILVALGISLFVPVAAPFRYAIMSVGFIAVLFLATGVVAIIGGIASLQRRRWGLALAGAICAIMPPSSLLGIVSTVFVAMARDEFMTGSATPAMPAGRFDTNVGSTIGSGRECGTELNEPSEAERNA